jgi:hypothetical protein
MPRNRLTMNPDYDPWDRQPSESAKHYGRFGYYRDMGPTRTVNKLHKMLNELGDKIKPDSIRQAAWEHRWADRAQAWDIAQQEADRERLVAERRDMIRRHRSVSSALMTQALKALRAMRAEDMSPRDVATWLKLATDIERVALGEPQHTVAVSGPAGGPIQTEDVSAMDPEQRRRRLAEIAAELARRAGIDADDDD